jgi:hypothetical protein
MTPQLIQTTQHATVRVGNHVYSGTKLDFALKDEVTGLVSTRSVLHPVMVRLVDNNKYSPHQSTREITRRKKQLNGW